MKIKGKNVMLFLPLFLRAQNFGNNISSTTIRTVYNFLSSYVQLSEQKRTARISVKDLVTRAGYSRTTFYTYFAEVQDVYNLIEDMISYHMYINSDIYLDCFLGNVTEQEEQEILSTIEAFSPYINALMLRNHEYEKHYRQDFINALSKVMYKTEIPEDDQPYLLRSLAGAMVSLIKGFFDEENPTTIQKSMECAKLLVQSLIRPLADTDK